MGRLFTSRIALVTLFVTTAILASEPDARAAKPAKRRALRKPGASPLPRAGGNGLLGGNPGRRNAGRRAH